MRSVIKIWLGIEIVVKLLVTLAGLYGALQFFVFSFLPDFLLPASFRDLNFIESISRGSEFRFYAAIILILSVIVGVSAFIAYRTVIKLNTAKHKYQLTLPMLGLFFLSSPIIALLMLFTPRKYLISQFPYYE